MKRTVSQSKEHAKRLETRLKRGDFKKCDVCEKEAKRYIERVKVGDK